ncbi:MAG TPA: Tex family protein [Gammaproteobacteria bacterium]
MNIIEILAKELSLNPKQIQAAVTLLDEGATVPFIARYRKEMTGAMDDGQLRTLEVRLSYMRELEDRRQVVLNSIEEQGKLTPALKQSILDAKTKTELEDLYLPYKPKRRTKGQIAIEAGLEPLAQLLFDDRTRVPEKEAINYINREKGIDDAQTALEGAKYILMERFAEDAALLGRLRDFIWEHGYLDVKVVTGKETEGAKFRDYFDYREPLKKIPSHRALAILRGRKEGVLRSSLDVDAADDRHPCEAKIIERFNLKNRGDAADGWLQDVARWTWRIKLSLQLETDLMLKLRQNAEEDAIRVFADNLHDLLLAAPAGPRVTMGLDPGFRTGVKVVIIGNTGKVLDYATIYPHEPQKRREEALNTLAALCARHSVELVSIGNGTASRETDYLVAELAQRHPELNLTKIVVSEAGASVYSASQLAAEEFPELDVTIRGAISIARRLQDPLAELVKIEPKAIGVGQYQHDVHQTQLARTLNNVVEDCVNAVGVDLNTASVPLLSRVSGLNSTTAMNIVQYREKTGLFKNRQELLKVPRLGAKAFEQAAGFLRIRGDNPLDASSVHPESYDVVRAIAARHNRNIQSMIGDHAFLRSLKPENYVTKGTGELTVRDIIKELEKPGRDPRPEFQTARFREGIHTLKDLQPEMVLEGVITNVTNFGAFVDIGVHQDGLVHISALADTFVKDPRTVVKAGQVVKVKVLEIDVERRRIALSMRLQDASAVSEKKASQTKQDSATAKKPRNHASETPGSRKMSHEPVRGALAGALRDALKKK